MGSALSTRWGSRPVVMVGGVLTSLGFVFSAFAGSLLHLYLGLGLLAGEGSVRRDGGLGLRGGTSAFMPPLSLAGCGWALAFAPALGTLSRYFSSRRVLAVGLALTGNGASSLLLAPALQLLLDTFGWRGALLLLGAVTLHLTPCGALLRPLALPGDSASPPRGPVAALGLGLFSRRAFTVFALGTAVIGGGYFVPYVHLAPHALDRGLGGYGAALVVAVAAVGDAGARLVCGWLADQGWVPLPRLLAVFGTLTGLAVLAVGLVPGVRSEEGWGGPLLAAAGAYGLSAGSYAPLVFGVLPGLVGLGGVVQATGLVMMLMSLGGLLGPPLSGKGLSWQNRSSSHLSALGCQALQFLTSSLRLPKGPNGKLHLVFPSMQLIHPLGQLHLHGTAGGTAFLQASLTSSHASPRKRGAASRPSGSPASPRRPAGHTGHHLLTTSCWNPSPPIKAFYLIFLTAPTGSQPRTQSVGP